MSICTSLFRFLPLGFLVLTWFSCAKPEVIEGENYAAYYPIEKGRYVIYDVDSTAYDDFNLDTISVQFQIKEKMDDYFTTSEGKTVMRLESYRRQNSTDAWGVPRAYWTYLEPTHAVKVVENIPYVLLQYPFRKNVSWDRNRYNFLGEEQFSYPRLFIDTLIAGIQYDSLLNVQSKASYTSLIDMYSFREFYGKNRGLVLRELIHVESVYNDKVGTDTLYLPVLQKIKKGQIYRMQLNSYGIE